METARNSVEKHDKIIHEHCAMKPVLWFIVVLIMQPWSHVWAMPFGTFVPRSMAMGGTGVASATADNAVFYNPALLAQYDYNEDEGRNSEFILPVISAHLSNTIEEIAKFKANDYDGKLSAAITDFNANNGAVSDTQSVLNASLNLKEGLSKVSNGPVFGDVNMAFSIAIPSFKQGGAFVFDKRAVGDGRVIKTSSDETLLNAYIETMQFLLTGQGAPSTEIYSNGQLNDQSGNLTSTASASGIVITEFGLAMAGEFPIFSHNFALGITPKFIKAETYATQANANSNSFGENRDFNKRWAVTADIGVARNINNIWNLGLTVKNVIPLRYTTNLYTKISIDPQLRAGVAYKTSWGIVSMDMDMLKNKPVGSGDKTQYSLLGVEWDLNWAKLRGGYNYNFSASKPVKKGLFSAGIQLAFFGMLLDVAYADNGVERAAALQTGFKF